MKFRVFRHFASDRRGNVAMIFALAAIPFFFAVGMGVDYANGARKWTAMDAAADAAALAAITPNMLAQSDAVAQTAAMNTFNGQVERLSGVSYNPSTGVTVTITDSGPVRTATVSYSAEITNVFGGILGMTTTPATGHSQASNAASSTTPPPNFDVYLMVDTSPSMAVPATTAGITAMMAATKSSAVGACAFACHESNPKGDGLNADLYSVAKGLNLTLQIDQVKTAVSNLISTAITTENANKATYRMAINTFDYTFNTISALSSNLSTVQTASANIQLLEVYDWFYVTKTQYNDDGDTNWNSAISSMNTLMPAPGKGTTASGDTPQEALIIITDGVNDSYAGNNRTESLMSTSTCTTIKSRGIKIAVIYTEYLPVPYNSQASDISSFQPNIGSTLQSCASPGLYFEVGVDGGDPSTALVSLFSQISSPTGTSQTTTAHLTQ
jgi:Flp pilus assembly protein TadG